MPAGIPGVVVAADQGRQSDLDRGRPAGLRVFNPEAFETGPVAIARVVVPGQLDAARAVLGRKRDERVAMAAALRAAGAKVAAIADLLGVKPDTVREYLANAREWGGLDDVLRDIEARAIPAAVENLLQGLEDGDKEYTLEVLKGRGIFRTFGNTKTEGSAAGTNMTVNVQFVQAPAVVETNPLAPVVGSTGEIVGQANRE